MDCKFKRYINGKNYCTVATDSYGGSLELHEQFLCTPVTCEDFEAVDTVSVNAVADAHTEQTRQ